jgi:hypothetical protein
MGIIDTFGKFATGVNNKGSKFSTDVVGDRSAEEHLKNQKTPRHLFRQWSINIYKK